MANKKNKKAKKPAAGKSAAGSNNKGAKKPVQKPVKPVQSKKESAPVKKSDVKKVSRNQKSREKKSNGFISSFLKNGRFLYEKIKEKLCRNKAATLITAAVILAVAAVIIVISAVNKNFVVPDYVKNAEFKGRTEPESVAFDMDISENQQKALVKATKVKGDKHKFDFFVNDSIVMSEYDDPALIEFGSADSNDCILVFFMLDEEGNEIYRSLGVEPGEQIRSVSFFDEIPYGTHDVTLAVLGYNPKTFKQVGMQTTQIKLEIGVD